MKTIDLNEIIKQVIEKKDYIVLDADQLIKDCMIKVVEVIADIIDKEEIFKVQEDLIIIGRCRI